MSIMYILSLQFFNLKKKILFSKKFARKHSESSIENDYL